MMKKKVLIVVAWTLVLILLVQLAGGLVFLHRLSQLMGAVVTVGALGV